MTGDEELRLLQRVSALEERLDALEQLPDAIIQAFSSSFDDGAKRPVAEPRTAGASASASAGGGADQADDAKRSAPIDLKRPKFETAFAN
jgi:hypothetical protein